MYTFNYNQELLINCLAASGEYLILSLLGLLQKFLVCFNRLFSVIENSEEICYLNFQT